PPCPARHLWKGATPLWGMRRQPMIRFVCEECGADRLVPDKMGGRKLRCQDCKSEGRVPLPVPDEQEEPAPGRSGSARLWLGLGAGVCIAGVLAVVLVLALSGGREEGRPEPAQGGGQQAATLPVINARPAVAPAQPNDVPRSSDGWATAPGHVLVGDV